MADISPFKGVLYDKSLRQQMDLLTTPPYDVISPREQSELYAKSPLNIIRLELPLEPGDGSGKTRYQAAAETYRSWLEEGILRQDEFPAYYVYRQKFRHGETVLERTGFIAALALVPYEAGQVLPHEETLPKHKEDRYQLMKACGANFSPIFGLYQDPEHRVDGPLLNAIKHLEPELSFTDSSGVSHELWAVTDPGLQRVVTDNLAALPVYIADGHHRYETSLALAQEMAAKGVKGYERICAALVNLYDPGLVVYPTHRVVTNVNGFDGTRFREQIGTWFTLEDLDAELNTALEKLAAAGQKGPAFLLYDGRFTLLKLKDGLPARETLPEHSAAWQQLDVNVLSGLILEPLLGITADQRSKETNLLYVKDEQEVLELVDSGKGRLAFLLNPTRIEQVLAVAAGGEKMPQKSTFFYPKLRTGLVINPLGTAKNPGS